MNIQTQGNKGFLYKMGEVQKAQGSSDLIRGKKLSIITLLYDLSSLGLPLDVFLYQLQGSFLVRNWLGTVEATGTNR